MAGTPKTPSTTGKRARMEPSTGSSKRPTPKGKKDDAVPPKASKGLRHFSMKVSFKVLNILC